MDIKNKKSRITVSLIMLIWAVVCIIITSFYVGGTRAEAASTGTLIEDYVYMRDAPAGNTLKYNGKDILLRKGQKMTITSAANKTWYKVKLTYKKKKLYRICIFCIYQGNDHHYCQVGLSEEE